MKHSFFAKFIVLNFSLLLVLLLGLSLFLRQPSVLLSFVKHRDLWLVDSAGKIQSSNTIKPLPIDWREAVIPAQKNTLGFFPGYKIERLVGVERIDNGTEPRFLIFQRNGRTLSGILWLCFLTFFPLVIVYVSICGYVLFSYLRRNEKIAKSVLADLRRGNLSSRFPITNLDEAGRLMAQFNEMASEIEKLFGKLNVAQRLRGEILKELAHDLKTPLTAIMLQLETVADAGATMTPSEVSLRMETLIQEMHFFRHLLEDLFTLSQLDEPDYHEHREEMNLAALASSEVLRAEDRCAILAKEIKVSISLSGKTEMPFHGDVHLLRRLFQNAIQNAIEQARHAITVAMNVNGRGDWEIQIDDDGSGFTAQAFEAFGKRRHSGLLEISNQGKVSLGLGSVILGKIVGRYGGSAKPSNRFGAGGQISGGRLTIMLPGDSKSALSKKAA